MIANLKICPICEHRQAISDPRKHNCISELRNLLQATRAELVHTSAALTTLQGIIGENVIESARSMRAEVESIPRIEVAARRRGYVTGLQAGIDVASKASDRSVFSRWLIKDGLAELIEKRDVVVKQISEE